MGKDLVPIKGPNSASTYLARYHAACREIAEIHAFDELLNIKNHSAAFQAYAHEARNFELERMAAEIRTRAECRAGELLIEMKKAGLRETGIPPKGIKVGTPTSRITLEELHVTKEESKRWQRLARVPKPKLEAILADKTTVPSADRIIRATKEPKQTSLSAEAVGLWSMLRDFENDGLLDKEPAEVLSAMTPAMLDLVHTLAPKIVRWLRRIGKISPST
jgi:hypothetical protein